MKALVLTFFVTSFVLSTAKAEVVPPFACYTDSGNGEIVDTAPVLILAGETSTPPADARDPETAIESVSLRLEKSAGSVIDSITVSFKDWQTQVEKGAVSVMGLQIWQNPKNSLVWRGLIQRPGEASFAVVCTRF